MAKIRLFSVFFLIALIFCQEVVDVEGRHLRRKSCRKCSKHHENTLSASKGGTHTTEGSGQEKMSKTEYVDDFRPTSPGHSPGVGHSINN
ncbi:hypothetical protein SLEP1_g11919 [Rubroshorea leprosula]|nr:hypothetical protein SLEP1_g11919 [Rubroshorea leprosula]